MKLNSFIYIYLAAVKRVRALIFLMLYIANLHDYAVVPMWSLKVSWSSKMTTRFLAELYGIIVAELS